MDLIQLGLIPFKEPWRTQPPISAEIDLTASINKGLLYSIQPQFNTAKNIVRGPNYVDVGVLGGGVSLTLGQHGRQFAFDGTQLDEAATFGNATIFDGLTELTLEVLLKFNSVSGDQKPFGKWPGTWLLQKTATHQVLFATDTPVNSFSIATTDANVLDTANKWYHILWSWLGGDNNICLVNGVLQANSGADPTATGLSDSVSDFQLGRSDDGEPLDGDVAFFNIWNRGLSYGELLQRSQAFWGNFKPKEVTVFLPPKRNEIIVFDELLPLGLSGSDLVIDHSKSINKELLFSIWPYNASAQNIVRGADYENVGVLGSGISLGLGQKGRHISFTGVHPNGGASFGDVTTFDGLTAITVEVLLKFNSLSGSKVLLSKWAPANATFSLNSPGATRRLDFFIITAFADIFMLSNNDVLDEVNKWYHCIWSWRGGNDVEGMVDGIPLIISGAAAGANTLENSSANFQLGRADDGGALDGDIAYANVWGRGLNYSEMIQRFENSRQILKHYQTIIPDTQEMQRGAIVV